MEIIDISNIKECRICFIDENIEPDKPFINPCACSGTSKWVHIECLNKWRKSRQNPTSESICSECRTQYNIIRKNFDIETLIYQNSYIQNINMFISMCSMVLSFILYSLNSFFDNSIIIGFKNNTNEDSYISVIIYFDISAFLIINFIIFYLFINIFIHVTHQKIYFRGIRSKLLILFIFNLSFLPIYQIGVLLKSIHFIVFLYTTEFFLLNFNLKLLLIKSNSIIKSINDENYIEDTILPYDPEIDIDLNESDIVLSENDNETLLLPMNHS